MLFLLAFALLAADEPVCPKCEMIREYNAAHPENNYTYYEDYLKDQAKKEQKPPELACGCLNRDQKKNKPQEREDHLFASAKIG